MSKNIIIQENGVAQALNTISVVETKGNPSGRVEWVPEDECQLGQVVVKSNGEITASEEGYYAFSKVTVKVPANADGNKAVGMNEDGEWEVWGVDEDGELVELGLPTRIEIVTPPDKTSYVAGEDIDIKGMVVNAYFQDDSDYGIINPDELIITPPKAVGGGDDYSDGQGINARGFELKYIETLEYSTRAVYLLIGDVEGDYPYYFFYVEGSRTDLAPQFPDKLIMTVYSDNIYITHIKVGGTAENRSMQFSWIDPDLQHSGGGAMSLTTKFKRLNSTQGMPTLAAMLPVSTSNPYEVDVSTLSEKATEETVTWNRVGDGQPLTDTFEITVTDQ